MEKMVSASIPADQITVEDCIDLYTRRGLSAICNDGKLEGFVEEHEKRSDKFRFIWLNANK